MSGDNDNTMKDDHEAGNDYYDAIGETLEDDVATEPVHGSSDWCPSEHLCAVASAPASNGFHKCIECKKKMHALCGYRDDYKSVCYSCIAANPDKFQKFGNDQPHSLQYILNSFNNQAAREQQQESTQTGASIQQTSVATIGAKIVGKTITMNESLKKMTLDEDDMLAPDDIFDYPISQFFDKVLAPHENLVELGTRELSFESGKRIPRYRIICCKGFNQFDKALEKYRSTNDEESFVRRTDNFDSVLLEMYRQVFADQENEEINKMSNRHEFWHIMVFGLFSGSKNPPVTNPTLKPIGAVSFLITPAIFVKWLAVTDESAKRSIWGLKSGQRSSIFGTEGSTFYQKGIGTYLIKCMQLLSNRINSFMHIKNCPQIVVESSIQSKAFYKYGLGFIDLPRNYLRRPQFKELLKQECIRSNDLHLLLFQGDLSQVRPSNVKSLPLVDIKTLRDNMIHNVYFGEKFDYAFEINKPRSDIQNSTNVSNYFFEAKTSNITATVKLPESNWTIDTTSFRCTRKQSSILLKTMFKIKDGSISLFKVPDETIGLFVLRILIHDLMTEELHASFMDINDTRSFSEQFFDLNTDRGFDVEKQLVSNLLWFLSKIKHDALDPSKHLFSKTRPHAVRNTYKWKNDILWYDKKDFTAGVPSFVSYFLIGSFVEKLHTYFDETITNSKLSANDIFKLLSRFGQKIHAESPEKDPFSSEAFLCLLSILFEQNISIVSFRLDKSLAKYNVECEYYNKHPLEKKEHTSNIILCKTGGKTNDDFQWSVCIKNDCIENITNIFKSKEDTYDHSNEGVCQQQDDLTDILTSVVYLPLGDRMYPDPWFLKIALQDGERWHYNFCASYVQLLQKKVPSDMFLDSYNTERKERSGRFHVDKIEIPSDQKAIVCLCVENAHYVVIVLDRDKKMIVWYDSEPIDSFDDECSQVIDILFERYSIDGEVSDWTHEINVPIITTVQDCGPIALDTIERLIAPSKQQESTPVERKIKLLKRYILMYYNFYFNEENIKTNHLHKWPLLNCLRSTTLDPDSSSVTNFLCKKCGKLIAQKKRELKVVVRNCSGLCMYHKACFQDSDIGPCSSCIKDNGRFFMDYFFRSRDSYVEYGIPFSWKVFFVGQKYGSVTLTRMFNNAELQSATQKIAKDKVQLAKLALDPDLSDTTYSVCNYKGISRFYLQKLRPDSWLTDDIYVVIGNRLIEGNKHLSFVTRQHQSNHRRKMSFSFQSMQPHVFYMFIVHQNGNHYFSVESPGNSKDFYFSGYLGSINNAIKAFQKLFKEELPNNIKFIAVKKENGEKQDGTNCGVIALRRIEYRASLDYENLAIAIVPKDIEALLGDYKTSRINYASMIAEFPIPHTEVSIPENIAGSGKAPDDPLLLSPPSTQGTEPTDLLTVAANQVAEIGKGPADDPLILSPPSTDSLAEAADQETSDLIIPSRSSRSSDTLEAAANLQSLATQKVPSKEALIAQTLRNQQYRTAGVYQESDDEDEDNDVIDELCSNTENIMLSSDKPWFDSLPSFNASMSNVLLPHFENQKMSVSVSYNVKGNHNNDTNKKSKKKQDNNDQNNDNDEMIEKKLLYDYRKLNNKMDTPETNYEKFKIWIGRTDNNDPSFESYATNLIARVKNTTVERFRKKLLSTDPECPNRRTAFEYTFANLSKEMYDEFQKQVNNHKAKIAAAEEALKKARNSKRSDATKVTALNDQWKYLKNNLSVYSDPTQYVNEVFFQHPSSIVALRYINNSREKRFGERVKYVGITNDVFCCDDGDNVPIHIPLPTKWVKQNFDQEFLGDLEKFCDGYVYLGKYAKQCVSQEEVNLSRKLVDKGSEVPIYSVETRGAYSGKYVIITLRLVALFTTSSEMPKEEKWEIKSVAMEQYIKLLQQPASFQEKHLFDNTTDYYLEIQPDLLFHPRCCGTTGVPHNQRKSAIEACKKHTWISGNDTWTYTTADHHFHQFKQITDLKQIDTNVFPQYSIGEYQIAGIKYDAVNQSFQGMALLSVKSNRRQYQKNIPLNEAWVIQQFRPALINKLKKLGETSAKKYLWVPCGKASKREFPFGYNVNHPVIKYQQGERDTCASSSLASCFHCMGLEDLASWIEQYGIELEKQQDTETDKFLSHLVVNLQKERKDFRKRFELQKFDIKKSADIFNLDQTSQVCPKLLQLVGSDGGVAHAVTIYKGLLFDSNLRYAVDLTKDNLEFCIDTSYVGVLHGYEFVPRILQQQKKKKRTEQQKKYRKRRRIERLC